MRTEDSSFKSDLRIYDDRKKPVDVPYKFALMKNAMYHFGLMSVLVLLHIYEVLPCQRLVPLVLTKVLRDKDGTALVRLDILRNKEPIDVINRFIQESGIAPVYGDETCLYRYNILQEICKEVLCTRSTLVVFKKTINDINGTSLGMVEVFELEEVVDAILCFLT